MEKEKYKPCHAFYNNIYELYDVLQDTVNDVEIKNEIILIKYQNDELKIKQAKNGYYITYFNDNKEKGVLEDQDIYYYALDFSQDNLKSGTFEIDEYLITNIDKTGMTVSIEAIL